MLFLLLLLLLFASLIVLSWTQHAQFHKSKGGYSSWVFVQAVSVLQEEDAV
jgi:hypothetical protein